MLPRPKCSQNVICQVSCAWRHEREELCRLALKFMNLEIPKALKITQRGDLVSIMSVCVCPKVKEMGSFSVSSE